MTTPRTINGTTVLVCDADGPPVAGEREALDLLGDAFHHGARWVAVPAERFDESFFRLHTRVAGDVIQKFANYRVGIVVLGDISRHTASSTALRDFVRECNRGGQTWFLADEEELRGRLAAD
ncbi:DUF4180 domain-containing protein [Streptomyces sp. NPDC012888]|uniref:DUF4180 domain-containing protein n=1 Tax=Streptomyces sp. NPDC012888 TaxID=3364855 RepID=UPI00369D0894